MTDSELKGQAAHSVVVIGAGQAGAEVAFALRQQHYPGRIVLIGDETHLPYRRPPLSKTYLSGACTAESLLIRNEAAYQKQNIEVRTGTKVVVVDRLHRKVQMADGELLSYSKLVLATGGRPRRLEGPTFDRANVHYIRTIKDIDSLRGAFVSGKRLVIVGGGYIGLETAAVAKKMGLEVTVLEAQARVLARVAAPEMSAFYCQAHEKRGVRILTGVTIREFEGATDVTAVLLADGARIAADLVVVGVGLIPNTELAEAAGLLVQNGVVVDEFARTSDADILAVGDCANHRNEFLGQAIRLESVPAAQEQARTAAATICSKPTPHHSVPWFWSDQFDLKLQMVGISTGYDRVVLRGAISAESFAVFYLKDGVVISAEAVNRPQEYVVAKKMVAARCRVDAARLADESTALAALAN